MLLPWVVVLPILLMGPIQQIRLSRAAPGFPFNGLGGFLLSTNIANPNIKPEMITENELGIEMTFFQNRISLVADVYKQKLKDGIVYTNTASSSGFTSSLINAASTETRGFEMELKATSLNPEQSPGMPV